VGKKTLKIAPSPCDFVTLTEKDGATAIGAIGNMHRTEKLAKSARVVPDISCGTDRHTDRHTDTNTDVLVLITILRHRCRGLST